MMGKVRSFFSSAGCPRKEGGLPPKTHFSIWYFVIMMLLIIALQQYFLSRKSRPSPYSQFKQELAQGNVEKLTIGPDNITGTLKGKDKKPAQQFITVRVDDPGLVKELDEHKVDYSGRYESKFLSSLLSWILPIGIMILIWRYAMRKMGPGTGVMSFAKSKAKLFAENETKVNFSDVAGIDEAKEELQEVVEFLKSPEKFQKTGREDPERRPSRGRAGHRARPFWRKPWPGRRKCLSSASAGPSSWRCSSAWGHPACATSSPRRQARRPASSSSTSWTRWGRPGA